MMEWNCPTTTTFFQVKKDDFAWVTSASPKPHVRILNP